MTNATRRAAWSASGNALNSPTRSESLCWTTSGCAMSCAGLFSTADRNEEAHRERLAAFQRKRRNATLADRLSGLLRACCANHRNHQVDSFGAVESVLSDQRAPGPEPNRVSDGAAHAGAAASSLSPSPHERGLHCREQALEALDRRSYGWHQWRVPEDVVKHSLIPFIPVVKLRESTPETLGWILDFDPGLRTRRRVEGQPVHRASAKEGILVSKVAVDGAALDSGLLGDCRHRRPRRADGTVKLHRRLGDS